MMKFVRGPLWLLAISLFCGEICLSSQQVAVNRDCFHYVTALVAPAFFLTPSHLYTSLYILLVWVG